ncbi:MAG: hypothetical protein ABT01_03605 [Clostridium sp. SCN 57-10]|nr:MAG: hypothetical protein ABT01_03605 [Clostridium sp. SCN 57-10]
MDIAIVGIGMGNADTLTLGARRALEEAQLVVGAQRMLDGLPDGVTRNRRAAIAPEDICAALRAQEGLARACVVMSGDVGFYSGAKKLLPLLSGHRVDCLCGVTTVQYLAAKLCRPWQDARLVSAHGVACNVVGSVLSSRETFFLTGGGVTPRTIAEALTQAGLGDAEVTVGENLSYPQERIVTDRADALCGRDFAPLSAVWVVNDAPRRALMSGGLPDDAFVRGDVPMTKQEVRAAAIARLAPRKADVIYDVGAGTGSVGLELALLSPMARVYAVECSPEACALVRENRERLGAYNLTLIEGRAPQALAGLPAPDCVFIGGSRGNLRAILAALREQNARVRVVMSAIALETLSEALSALREQGFGEVAVTQIAVSRARAAGAYHMMTGQNPVFLLSAEGVDA